MTREDAVRDPKRIPELLEAVRRVWEAHPDLRLGQLIGNCAHSHIDTYFIDDHELLRRLPEVYGAGVTVKDIEDVLAKSQGHGGVPVHPGVQ